MASNASLGAAAGAAVGRGIARQLPDVRRAAPAAASRAATPPIGLVVLMTDDGELATLARLGDGAWQVTQGGNAWDEVALPNRTSATVWKGRPPIAIAGELLFDGWGTGQNVAPAIRTLQKMWGIGAGITNPVLQLNAHGLIPFDATTHPTLRWFIDSLDFADDAIRDRTGRLRRQSVNVTLKNYRVDARLAERSAATRARTKKSGGTKPAHRRYTVRKGDTLVAIAKREYGGNVDRWPDIARANGLRDGRAPLKPGRVLNLP